MADDRNPMRDDQERPEQGPMDSEREFPRPEKGYESPKPGDMQNPARDDEDDESIEAPGDGEDSARDQLH
jgi:hypothetical protein